MKKILVCLITILLVSCNKNYFSNESITTHTLDNIAIEYDFEIHSYGYMLVDLADFDILYAKNTDERIYPASLTKLLTLDAVLHYADSLDDHSYVTYQQVQDMIDQDASLAFIKTDYSYSLLDLLYALNLPSGADAAVALENYFTDKGIVLVDLMNQLSKELGCTNSNFVNTTGLHDDNHYTSIDDLFLIVMDILKYPQGREILTSLSYTLEDDIRVSSGIRYIYNSITEVLGGKTGYTPEAGQNVIVLYRHNSRPYLLINVNAMGSYSYDQYWHYEDALQVFAHLY